MKVSCSETSILNIINTNSSHIYLFIKDLPLVELNKRLYVESVVYGIYLFWMYLSEKDPTTFYLSDSS